MARITDKVVKTHLRDACDLAAIAAGFLFAMLGIVVWAMKLGWPAWVADLVVSSIVFGLLVRSHLAGMATLHKLAAELAERERNVCGWPLRTARARARASLANPVDWDEVLRAKSPPPAAVGQLGPQLQRFFTEYESAYICETIHLTWSVIAPSVLVPGAIRIADCDEGEYEWVAMPGKDRILAVDPRPDGVHTEEIPTVWHLVCEHGLAGEELTAEDDD